MVKFNNKDKIVNSKDKKLLFNKDEIFSSIDKKYGSPSNVLKPQGFISLSKIIIGQQVSLESANSHFQKLRKHTGKFIPEVILKLSDEEMRSCHISRQKAEYLRSLSSAILNKKIDLKKLCDSDHSEIRDQLKTIKGIGDWTVDIYLMFSLQAKDIFPSGDIAVINTVKELTGMESKKDAVEYSEKWKPYRSLASFYFWHYYLKKRNRELIL